MAGLKGSGLRAPSLKLGGGFLSNLRNNKEYKDSAKMRTTALVAGVSFCVSVGGVGAWKLMNNDEGDAGAKTDGARATSGDAVAAEAPLAASLVVDGPATAAARTPQTPNLAGATLYRDAVARLNAGDRTNGLAILRRVADSGYPSAQLYLAELYETGGAGLTRDPVQARRWTERAAQSGDRKAMHNLALFHVNGEGGAVDVPTAAIWFRRAAEGGVVDSQYNLGYLYEQGRGVTANPAEAYKWYLIASRQGDAEARSSVERLRPNLTPQAIAAAERSAAAFRGAPAATAAPVRTAAAAPVASAAAPPAGGSAEVATAQQILTQLGYYRGPADGVTSPALRRALAAWQRDAGLPATGSATPETLVRLNTAAAAG
jgi:localization factor PodJL